MGTTVFLLGAGASREAGFPLMDDLTRGFPHWLTKQDVSLSDPAKLLKAYQAAEKLVGGEDVNAAPNIEFVMRFLTDLHSFKSDHRHAVHAWKKPFGDLTTGEIEELLEVLRQYMKDELRLGDRGEAGDYLDALFDFIPDDGCLDVFTLNYDRLLEARCSLREKRFTTGFGDAWAPALFESNTWELRIHKLHGSVDWYRLPRSGLVYRGEEYHFAYPDEKPASAALYPAGTKAAYAEPFSTLRSNFIWALSKASKLIVVGYSFADEHVRRLVLDQLRTNQELEVMIVDPQPQAMLQMERPAEVEPIFSDFPDRVVGLWATARAALQDRRIRIREAEIANASRLRSQFLEHRGAPHFSEASEQLLMLADYLWETDMPGKAEVLLDEVQGDQFRERLEGRILAEVRWIRHQWGQHTTAPTIQPGRKKGKGARFPQLVLRWLLAHALDLKAALDIEEVVTARVEEWMAGLVIVRGDQALGWSVQQTQESRDVNLPVKIWEALGQEVKLLEPRGLGFPWLERVPKDVREKAEHLKDDLANLRSVYDLLRARKEIQLFQAGGSVEVFVRIDQDSNLGYLDEVSAPLIASGFLDRWGQNPSWQGRRKRLGT